MLPIQTLKSIRKWRDRLFMLGERALDVCQVRGRKRILLWPWKELEEPVRRSFWFTRHEVVFAPIPPGGEGFDLVVPLSAEALLAVAADEPLRRRNPLPIPDPAAVNLCEDKASFNRRLRELGFGRHIPDDARPGCYPYILKRRVDSASRNIFRIDGPADEYTHRERIASTYYLRQELVLGETEYAAHLLVVRGRVRRAITLSFRMEADRAIKGRDHVKIARRCHARHLDLFESMLNAIGFEGLCCVNYKVRDGVPMVFEINPRFGFTLAPFFSALVRSLEWQRAGQGR